MSSHGALYSLYWYLDMPAGALRDLVAQVQGLADVRQTGVNFCCRSCSARNQTTSCCARRTLCLSDSPGVCASQSTARSANLQTCSISWASPPIYGDTNEAFRREGKGCASPGGKVTKPQVKGSQDRVELKDGNSDAQQSDVVDTCRFIKSP